MVAAITVGMPDFNGGPCQRLGGIEALIDMAGNFDRHAWQIGEIQVAILQFGHAGYVVGTFRGFDRDGAGLFFRCRKPARLERFCKINCGTAKGGDKSTARQKAASSNFHCRIFLGCFHVRRPIQSFSVGKMAACMIYY